MGFLSRRMLCTVCVRRRLSRHAGISQPLVRKPLYFDLEVLPTIGARTSRRMALLLVLLQEHLQLRDRHQAAAFLADRHATGCQVGQEPAPAGVSCRPSHTPSGPRRTLCGEIPRRWALASYP